jgi:predicted transcriptional regulator
MKRTTISLPDDLAAALGREAARRRTSVSQDAREAIEARLGWDDEEPRDVPFVGMVASGGKFGNLSEYVDTDEFKKEYADWIYRGAFDRDP